MAGRAAEEEEEDEVEDEVGEGVESREWRSGAATADSSAVEADVAYDDIENED